MRRRLHAPTTRGSWTNGPRWRTAFSEHHRLPAGSAGPLTRSSDTRATRDRRRLPTLRRPRSALGPPLLRPDLEAAEAADLPVLLHSVTVTHPVFPFNNHGFDTEFARHACSHTFSIIANLVHMVSTGVVVRYPNLRIGVTEAGVSWMPFLMLPAGQGVPRAPTRRAVSRRSGRVTTSSRSTSRRSRSRSRRTSATSPADRPLRRLGHHGVRVGLAPSRLRPSHEGRPDSLTPDQRRKIFSENALRLLKIDGRARRTNLEHVDGR